LYVIGIVATGLLVITQVILHKNYKILHMPSEEIMTATITDSEEAMDFLNNMLEKYNISVGGMKCRKKDDGYIEVEMDVSIDADIDYNDILRTFKDAPYVHSITI
ncbi:MAG: hypothetical protein IJR79_02760, partial [Clostridia bacterium]|nr:hypothetical protein [Clostridia bacterium]